MWGITEFHKQNEDTMPITGHEYVQASLNQGQHVASQVDSGSWPMAGTRLRLAKPLTLNMFLKFKTLLSEKSVFRRPLMNSKYARSLQICNLFFSEARLKVLHDVIALNVLSNKL